MWGGEMVVPFEVEGPLLVRWRAERNSLLKHCRIPTQSPGPQKSVTENFVRFTIAFPFNMKGFLWFDLVFVYQKQ